MALVFKIKLGDTLRRWVVSDSIIEPAGLPGIEQVHDKIRQLFHLAPTTSIVVTYLDKDEDVVTLAEDQDLVDACFEQSLNPLRLDVKIHEDSLTASASPSTELAKYSEDGNANAVLREVRPPAPADFGKQMLSQAVETASVLWPNIRVALNSFLKALSRENGWEMSDEYHTYPASNESPTSNSLAPRPPAAQAYNSDSFQHRYRSGKGARNRIVHRGIQCDGCRIGPIEGCRYISKRKANYDLCSSCFDLIGNETDYQRIDHPLPPPSHNFRDPPHAWKQRRPRMGPRPGRPLFAHGQHSWHPEVPVVIQSSNLFPPSEGGDRLDARVAEDITIHDGTDLLPCTKFTKVWRLTNVGTTAWPQNTRLARIEGAVLGSNDLVNLKIPEGGLTCGADVEASVELIAPGKTGHYVSHWCLLSPSGQMFGHKLSVAIQVVPLLSQESLRGEESCECKATVISKETVHPLNFGIGNEALPSHLQNDRAILECHGGEEKQMCNLDKGNAKSVIEAAEQCSRKDCIAGMVDVTSDAKDPLVNGKQRYEQYKSATINSDFDGFSVIEKPIEIAEWDVLNPAIINSKDRSTSCEQTVLQHNSLGNLTDQEVQLQLLESMGYTDRALNVELLEKNNLNLELTINDLIQVDGWSNILTELKSMGFNDKATNCRLLMKNQGSIKWVVKHLMQMEKDNVGQTGKETVTIA